MIDFNTDKKSLFKTVVTEVRSFIVDATSKQAVSKQTTATAIPPEDQFEKIDCNVTISSHYTINSFNSLFHVSTLEPVKIVMIGTGTHINPTIPNVPEVEYHTAKITIPNQFISGQPLPVTIEDADLPDYIDAIGAVAYNANSGETEHFELKKIGVGTYRGEVTTNNNFATGINFDGVLNTFVGQLVQILYSDQVTASKKRETITAQAGVTSPTKTAILNTRNHVVKGRPLPILIKDDAYKPSVPIYVQNVSTGENKILDVPSIDSGIYGISIPTVDFNGFNSFEDSGSMGVAIGHVIRITYTDTNDVRGSVTNIAEDISIVGGITEAAKLTVPDSVYQNTYMEIVIEDYDATGTQIAVTVSNEDNGKYTVVPLFETIAGSGLFSGELLIKGTETETPKTIYAENGTDLNVVYVDNVGTASLSKKSTVMEKTITSEIPSVEEPVPEDPIKTGNMGEVEFSVNGTFVVNGTFKGFIRIEGLTDKPTKCTLLLS